MAKFCAWCGKQIDDGDVFCAYCGKRADGSDAPAAPQPAAPAAPAAPRQPQPPQQWQQPARQPGQGAWTAAPQPPQPPQQWPRQPQPPQWQTPPPQKKGGTGLIIGVVAAVLALVIGVGGFVWPGFFKKDKDGGGKTDIPKAEATAAPEATKTPVEKPDAPKETKAPAEKPVETPAPTPEPTPEPTEAPYINPFTDVKEGDWYYDAVMWAGKNGVVTGTEFKPDDLATRGQALTFIWRAAGEPEPALKVSPFNDVKEGDWYYKPVLWGFENGLISTGDGQFRSGDDLTRAQAVTFLSRATDGSPKGHGRNFWDATAEDWYFDAANWALEQGIVGRDDRYAFFPNNNMSRSNLITMLYRAFDPDAPRAATAPPDASGFAALGINIDVDNFGPKYYNTFTKNGKAITYSAVVTDYRVFEEADGYPKWDGYEYRVMTIEFTRATESDGSGTTHLIMMDDYYNTKLNQSSYRQDDNEIFTFTVLYNGELVDYTLWQRTEAITGGIRCTWTATVPKGYDGVVVGYQNNSLSSSGKSLGEYYTVPEDFAAFRMK